MNVNLPQPADYNFMLRLMKIFPPIDTSDRDEVLAWTSLRSVDRVRSAALYTVVLATACTTTLYGLNLVTNSLIMWGMGVITPPLINELLGSILNTPNKPQIADKDVAMFSTPKKAFPLWLGCSVADNLYPGSYWLGPYGGEPNIARSFAGIQGLCTPQLFSPLVCDNWLIVRPIEWGISAPQPKANFRNEVRISGAMNRQGWYASLGSHVISAPGGGTRPSQPITGGAFPYHLGRIPGDNRNTLNVLFIPPRQITEFDRAPLEKFYNAGVPSDRFIDKHLPRGAYENPVFGVRGNTLCELQSSSRNAERHTPNYRVFDYSGSSIQNDPLKSSL
jgi:hypothetical protein